MKKNNEDIDENISGTTPTQIYNALDPHTNKIEKYKNYLILLCMKEGCKTFH